MLFLSNTAEKEVERLLLSILPGSPFAGKVFAVGGYVRDELLGKTSKDLDIAVELPGGAEALANYIHDIFPGDVSTPRKLGSGYPIWGITFKNNVMYNNHAYQVRGADLDIADTQTERFPDAFSRQREVQYGTLDEDVRRRDFTVNMLMKDLTTGKIVDLSGTGVSDLKNGLLRHHPDVSPDEMFGNDPLRMLRLIRFMVKYNWDAHPDLIKAIKRNAERINIISAERIRDELVKIMNLGGLNKAIRFMADTGLLRYVMPEIEELRGVQQDDKYHAEGDVFEHTMRVLEKAKPTPEAQLAALLHDAGKPAVQEFVGDRIKFIGHEKVSGEIAEALLRRLKFDNNTIKKVRSVVENHMRAHTSAEWTNKAVRKFIRETADFIDDLLDLTEIDALSSITPSGEPKENPIPYLRKRIKEQENIPVRTKPILSGKDIMNILDIPPSPEVGKVLNMLQDIYDEMAAKGVEMTREEAIDIVREYKNDNNQRTGKFRVLVASTSDLLKLSRRLLEANKPSDRTTAKLLIYLYETTVKLYRLMSEFAMGEEVDKKAVSFYVQDFLDLISTLFVTNPNYIENKKGTIEMILGKGGFDLLKSVLNEVETFLSSVEENKKETVNL